MSGLLGCVGLVVREGGCCLR